MASINQRRCVFVGNIPYDATEEQLIQICEEVGPVVSFRLVIDRETGKPKGYGFCEYKDEETALSARRNLQGYDINGRQLRVDFAENDKTNDRGREQGRGGPGMPSSVDSQKQMGGPVPGDTSRYQPIGIHSAINAAAVAAGAIGAVPLGMNQKVLPGQSAGINDPLTLHLAKLSRSQLTDVISEVKMMATQNMESARKLLLAKPQLAKALFQAQIMLGLVTPQMLQTVSNQHGPSQFSQHAMRDGQHGQLPGVQSLPGLPPLAQTRMQSAMMPKTQEGQVPAAPHSSLVQNQTFDSQPLPVKPPIQNQRDINNQVLQSLSAGNSGISTLPSSNFPSSTNLSARPQIQVAHSSSNPPMQPPLPQQRQFPSSNIGLGRQNMVPNSVAQRSADGATWAHSSTPMGVIGKSMPSEFSDQFSRPSKLLRMDDASSASFPVGTSYIPNKSGSGPSDTSGFGTLPNPVNKTEEVQYSSKQTSQLAPEMESALLQQVLSLTPEQLSLLPPDQQQQVIQLQQTLRKGQFQPS